jgi:hypothetical protein
MYHPSRVASTYLKPARIKCMARILHLLPTLVLLRQNVNVTFRGRCIRVVFGRIMVKHDARCIFPSRAQARAHLGRALQARSPDAQSPAMSPARPSPITLLAFAQSQASFSSPFCAQLARKLLASLRCACVLHRVGVSGVTATPHPLCGARIAPHVQSPHNLAHFPVTAPHSSRGKRASRASASEATFRPAVSRSHAIRVSQHLPASH